MVQQIGRKTKSKIVDKKLDRAVNFISGSKRPNPDTVVMIKSNNVDEISGVMAPLPSNKKGMTKAVRKLDNIHLDEDERLVMVDTGAFCHAVDAEVEFPQHSIEPLKTSEMGKDAESACGGIMRRLGKIRTEGTVEGMQLNVRWNVMKVKVPILSVRRLVHDNHEVSIGRDGGFLHNLRNDDKIPFFEHQGVYYLKMKIHRPSDAQVSDPLFSRRAA